MCLLRGWILNFLSPKNPKKTYRKFQINALIKTKRLNISKLLYKRYSGIVPFYYTPHFISGDKTIDAKQTKIDDNTHLS